MSQSSEDNEIEQLWARLDRKKKAQPFQLDPDDVDRDAARDIKVDYLAEAILAALEEFNNPSPRRPSPQTQDFHPGTQHLRRPWWKRALIWLGYYHG